MGREAESPGQTPGPGRTDGRTDTHTHTRQNLYILAMRAVKITEETEDKKKTENLRSTGSSHNHGVSSEEGKSQFGNELWKR